MTRLGKIARLPREIREELNVRLQNGEVGRLLVDWLNGLPAAKAVLKERFEGRPITDGNLSEWKQGGYEDWVRHQENCALACLMTEMSGDLEKEAGESRLEERLVASLVMALARELREAEELADGAERLKRVLEIGRHLSQIRRESHQAERVRIEQERWGEKMSEICQRQHAEAEKAARSEAIWERTKAQFPSLRPLDGLEAELEETKQPRGRGKGVRGGARERKDQTVGDQARPHPGPLPLEREITTAATGMGQRRSPARRVKGESESVGDEARPQNRTTQERPAEAGYPGVVLEHESRREPPHPDPLLHKCVEEREMERTRVQRINARNSSANSLPRERENTTGVAGQPDELEQGPVMEMATEKELKDDKKALMLRLNPTKSDQIRPLVGEVARPHPDLLPVGEGTAGAAVGVAGEVAGTASQTQSSPIKPRKEN